jgi:CRP-like cAMP-binding protein
MLKAEKIPRSAVPLALRAKQWRPHFRRGQRIYAGEAHGGAWRVLSGSVRLDREEPNGEQSFATLAVQNDIIGAETLLFGKYTFTATALSDLRSRTLAGRADRSRRRLAAAYAGQRPSAAPPRSSACAVGRPPTVSAAW